MVHLTHPAYKKSHVITGFIFNEEIMEQFRRAWLLYDPEGSGMISVSDYFNLVINLPPPIRLTEDQLLRKLGKYLFEYKSEIQFIQKL
jgi:streptomycin 6-kinase